MKTVVIQIGNTDNKLTQQDWARFVRMNQEILERWGCTIHFFGGSATYEQWQNVCWVVVLDSTLIAKMFIDISKLRGLFSQDSVAVMVGETEFI